MQNKKKKHTLIESFSVHKGDTGSAPVQIALLTERINNLVEHLKAHPKDNDSRRGMLIMLSRRRKMLKYLEKGNPEAYSSITERLHLS